MFAVKLETCDNVFVLLSMIGILEPWCGLIFSRLVSVKCRDVHLYFLLYCQGCHLLVYINIFGWES